MTPLLLSFLLTITVGRGYQDSPLPTFDRGYLLFIDHPNRFEVWAPDGKLRYAGTVMDPSGVSISSLAVNRAGEVAVSFAFTGAGGVTGGIEWFTPVGQRSRFVETGRYMPAHICFDDTGALWTFGWQRGPDNGEQNDYQMFRKYAPDGALVSAFGDRSLFPAGLAPGAAITGGWRLRASGNRVGAIAFSGKTSASQTWIELDLEGRVMGQWPMGHDPGGGTAFTSDSRLCRQVPGNMESPVECFDRGAATWRTVTRAQNLGILLGAKGDELVFGRDSAGIELTGLKLPPAEHP